MAVPSQIKAVKLRHPVEPSSSYYRVITKREMQYKKEAKAKEKKRKRFFKTQVNVQQFKTAPPSRSSALV